MFIPDPESRIKFFSILDPDPGVKKAPDPVSATEIVGIICRMMGRMFLSVRTYGWFLQRFLLVGFRGWVGETEVPIRRN